MNGWTAVIDLGSNSARLVVYRVAAGGQLEIWDDVRASLRLSQELDEGNRLSDVAIERTCQVLEDFLSISLGAGVASPFTVATSAVRDAANSSDLVARVRKVIGLEVEVLGGDEEARLAFLGAVHGLSVERGVLMDVGGGSVEVARFVNRRVTETWTLPLGSLRVSDEFLASDPPRKSEVARLEEHVGALLAEAGLGRLSGEETLVATGGTVRNLAKILRRRSNYPVPRLHGYVIGADALSEVTDLVVGRSTGQRAKLSGLNADRADSIAGGAIVIRRMATHLGASEIIVSGQGLREGLVYSRRDGAGLPDTQDVRAASLRALVERFGSWDEAVADRRAKLAADLLESLAPDAPEEMKAAVREASWILDLGRSIDFYNRFDHTSMIVLESDLAGLSHRDLALLSVLVLMAGGERVRIGSLHPLLHSEDRVWVEKGGAVIALADEIVRRVPGASLGDLRWEVKGTAMALGPVPLGAWRTRSLTVRFHRAFGLRLTVNGSEGLG